MGLSSFGWSEAHSCRSRGPPSCCARYMRLDVAARIPSAQTQRPSGHRRSLPLIAKGDRQSGAALADKGAHQPDEAHLVGHGIAGQIGIMSASSAASLSAAAITSAIASRETSSSVSWSLIARPPSSTGLELRLDDVGASSRQVTKYSAICFTCPGPALACRRSTCSQSQQ